MTEMIGLEISQQKMRISKLASPQKELHAVLLRNGIFLLLFDEALQEALSKEDGLSPLPLYNVQG